jgi:hypothetical protein
MNTPAPAAEPALTVRLAQDDRENDAALSKEAILK